jgi:hypothetical protein
MEQPDRAAMEMIMGAQAQKPTGGSVISQDWLILVGRGFIPAGLRSGPEI